MIFLSTLLISMFITMALIPILRMAAVRLHAGLDVPDARKVHTEPVPKVGGLAMAIGALVPVVLVADGGRFVNSVLIGACVIVALRAGGRPEEPGLEGQVRRSGRSRAGGDPLREAQHLLSGQLPAGRA